MNELVIKGLRNEDGARCRIRLSVSGSAGFQMCWLTCVKLKKGKRGNGKIKWVPVSKDVLHLTPMETARISAFASGFLGWAYGRVNNVKRGNPKPRRTEVTGVCDETGNNVMQFVLSVDERKKTGKDVQRLIPLFCLAPGQGGFVPSRIFLEARHVVKVLTWLTMYSATIWES